MNQPTMIIIFVSIVIAVTVSWFLTQYAARYIVPNHYEWLKVLDENTFKLRGEIRREMLRIKNFRYHFVLNDVLYGDLETLISEGLISAEEFKEQDSDFRCKRYILTELGKEKRRQLAFLENLQKGTLPTT